MAETLRSVTELLDVLFASGQAPRSITEQDVRDAIVSISLETADFSDLPRSSEDLQIGRCWIDLTTALRVVTVYLPGLASSATLDGSGSLFADGQIAGHFIFPVSSTIRGSAAFTANTFARQSTSVRLNGSGAATVGVTILRQRAAAGIAGGANTIAIPAPTVAGSYSSAYSSAYRTGGYLTTIKTAGATLSPTSGISATPQRSTTTAWNPSDKSIYISLSGGASFSSTAFSAAFSTSGTALTATKTALNGWYGGVRTPVFRSGGKWYWEIGIGPKAGDTGVGLANPSWLIDNSDPAFGSYLGSDTNSVGLYGGATVGYTNDLTTQVTPMPNVAAGGNVGIALDCDNWKWWARQDGGAWNAGQAGAQDPATNQGGIPLSASYRVGGMGPAVTLQAVNDAVTARFSAPFSYTPPSGFAEI